MNVLPEEVEVALVTLNMTKYQDLFLKKSVDSAWFFSLTEDDLRTVIGIQSEADIKRLIAFVGSIRFKGDGRTKKLPRLKADEVINIQKNIKKYFQLISAGMLVLSKKCSVDNTRDIQLNKDTSSAVVIKDIYQVYCNEHEQLQKQILALNPEIDAYVQKFCNSRSFLPACAVFCVTAAGLLFATIIVKKN